ncbi:hypothetical protein [Neptunomonas sp. XY-337]|uniref:hypothetical protein n=1 Tax=Neptunomonas sp. XY-337 TaxID=2561897 RepID=UPI0010AB3D12|nr:hypothetical protein [Neptunomonas sp. XY-337]
MSIGGLLATALVGGVAGVAEGQVSRRKEEMAEKKARALEMLRHNNSMAVAQQRERGANERLTKELAFRESEGEKDRKQRGILASVKAAQTTGLKVGRYKPVTQDDGSQSVLDTATGEFINPSAAEGGAISPDHMAAAHQYAEEKINQQAGWLSTDKSDFGQFGGDRDKAREFYENEYFQKAGLKQNALQALQSKFGAK